MQREGGLTVRCSHGFNAKLHSKDCTLSENKYASYNLFRVRMNTQWTAENTDTLRPVMPLRWTTFLLATNRCTVEPKSDILKHYALQKTFHISDIHYNKKKTT